MGAKPPTHHHPDQLYYHVQRNELPPVLDILTTHTHLANRLYKNRPLLSDPSRRGHDDMVKLLISCGANVNNCSKSGVPPIW